MRAVRAEVEGVGDRKHCAGMEGVGNVREGIEGEGSCRMQEHVEEGDGSC